MRTPITIRTLALAATGALALSAAPAAAQVYERDDDDDGIGAGEVIAGAAILGGLAAILGGDDDDDRYRDDRYRNDRYRDDDDYYYDDRYDGQYYRRDRAGYARELIERCVYAAENDARRYGNADVTQIGEVRRRGRYTRVSGNIRIAQGYARDRRGRQAYGGEVDDGQFDCYVDRRGRVSDITYDDIDDVRRGRRYRR